MYRVSARNFGEKPYEERAYWMTTYLGAKILGWLWSKQFDIVSINYYRNGKRFI